MRSSQLISLLLTMAGSAAAQHPVATESRQPFLALDSLRRTSGPGWSTARSRHFVLYVERPSSVASATQMLDSLEDAWVNAVELLGARDVDETPTPVFVTRSRSRFGRLVPPVAKGLTTSLAGGGDVMILVRNDTVRAHTRHEVMHLLSTRAWGTSRAHGAWLIEGLATFAEGWCQRSTIRAVGRDLLAARPAVVANDVLTNFLPMWESDRAAAYVLAGTFVDYLWATRGRDGVRRLWQGTDSLSDAAMVPGLPGALTAGWRAHIKRVAGSDAGLDTAAFRRLGCG